MRFALGLAFALMVAGCAPRGVVIRTAPLPPPTEVAVTLLHFNDVYEITPVAGGREGGLARVAAYRRYLLDRNPNTYTVLPGDFYSPSALGTARVDGQRLNGKQMVALLNTLGLDLAAFGNHEFDLDSTAFFQRLAESRFGYVATNLTDGQGRPFPGSRRVHIERFCQGALCVRVGFLGLTIDSNPKPYVRYRDPLAAAREAVAAYRDSVDAFVALTHLALAQDIALAEQVPELALVLGGHEHENIRVFRGADFTPILKADANVRTLYIHDLYLNPTTKGVRVASELVRVTDALPEDSTTAAEVAAWVERGFAGFRAQGFDPGANVAQVPIALDGREASVRNQHTDLTALIADALFAEARRNAPGTADLAIYNSGSIRIDDVLPPGPVTQYDVIRILPFGGAVLTVEMPGALLDSTLTQGVANRGSGGFLQTALVTGSPGAWRIDGVPLDPARTYRVAITDFLVSGRETGLGWLNLDTHPHLRKLADHRDVRMALIDELVRRYGG